MEKVPKHTHLIKMGPRPWCNIHKNVRALAGLVIQLGQTWTQHDSALALTWPKKMDTQYTNPYPYISSFVRCYYSQYKCLRPCQISTENFWALAGQKLMLVQTWSKHFPNKALKWSQKVDTPLTFSSDHIDLVLKILGLV